MSGPQITSLFAYHKHVIPTLTQRMRQVQDALAKADDMTNSELARALGWGINRVTPRIGELRDAGLVGCRNEKCPNRAHLNAARDVVHDDCKRRCGVTGVQAFAWKIIN